MFVSRGSNYVQRSSHSSYVLVDVSLVVNPCTYLGYIQVLLGPSRVLQAPLSKTLTDRALTIKAVDTFLPINLNPSIDL